MSVSTCPCIHSTVFTASKIGNDRVTTSTSTCTSPLFLVPCFKTKRIRGTQYEISTRSSSPPPLSTPSLRGYGFPRVSSLCHALSSKFPSFPSSKHSSSFFFCSYKTTHLRPHMHMHPCVCVCVLYHAERKRQVHVRKK